MFLSPHHLLFDQERKTTKALLSTTKKFTQSVCTVFQLVELQGICCYMFGTKNKGAYSAKCLVMYFEMPSNVFKPPIDLA